MRRLGQKVISGAVWASVDKMGSMAIQFLVNLVLARLLMPEDFGYIGMLAIFISVSQTLIDGGFGSALIQKKAPSQEDYSTIFYWNILFSAVLYLILFLISPLVASFFNMPLLCDVLRVLGLVIVINSLTIIQNNRLRKQLAFRTIALINVGSLMLAAVIAIYIAYKGYGVWSLVAMQLLYGIFQNCFLWGFVRWYPSLQFSLSSLKSLFSFGGYLLASNILQEICKNMQGLIIGKKFSATQMGYYSQAKKLDDVCSYTLPNIIVQVIFPVYSQFQDDHEKLCDLLGISIRLIAYLIFPLMLLLILIAEPLILFLYGDKWIFSVPYFQILCVGGIFVCLQNINYYAVAAVGKSRVLFNWSFYKWSVLLLLLFVGAYWGMHGILWGMVINSMNIYMVNAFLANKYVGYSVMRQMKDFVPILVVSTLSYIGVIELQHLFVSMHFAIIVLIFIVLYVFLTYICRLRIVNDVVYILNMLRRH